MSLRISQKENGNSGILYIGFNQDQSCFAVGLESGFRIFNADPLKEYVKHDFDVRDGTGIGYVEMLQRTNFLGLLGGGFQARFPLQTACIFNCKDQDFVVEMKYAMDVKAVKLRSDRIIVVLLNEIRVYTFNKPSLLVYNSDTYTNSHGLCHVCQTVPIIAFPGKSVGTVLLVNVGNQPKTNSSVQACPPPRQIEAHRNPLAALIMNSNGSLLATASQKGTLIRIYDTNDCQLKHELRRGSNPAFITSLSFNSSCQYLSVTSDHGTVHIFDLQQSPSQSFISTGGSSSSMLLPKYLTSHFSRIKCVLDTKFKCICAFSEKTPNTLIVLAANGSYYKYNFTANGTVNKETSISFLHHHEDSEELV